MTTTHGPILEILVALRGRPGPVRYPELYATVDRLFRAGLDEAALGGVVRWLLTHDLATVRDGGLHLRAEVATIANKAQAALDGDPSIRDGLIRELGLPATHSPEAPSDVAIRMLLAPPVPATWPLDPTRGWSLMDAVVIAAASRTGQIRSTRVRQLWFNAKFTELEQHDLEAAVRRLTTAGLVTMRPATLTLTRTGRRCRSSARRRLSWLDNHWSGDQTLWAALASLADGGAAPVSRPDQAPIDQSRWLDRTKLDGSRHARR